MANLSDFTGNNPVTDNGQRVVSRFVDETEYAAIDTVSREFEEDGITPNPDYDPTSLVFDEFFDHTLYYINEV